MKRTAHFGLLALLLALAACREAPAPEPQQPLVEAPPPEPEPVFVETEYVLERGDTLGKLFERADLPLSSTHSLVEALKPFVDPRKVRPGHSLTVKRDEEGTLVSASWKSSRIDIVDIFPEQSGWRAEKREITLETELSAVSVSIQSSLWDAFVAAGEDPTLAVLASDVLAWEIDFYRDVRPGDRLELLVEKVMHENERVRYGELRAVRYDSGRRQHEFFRFEHDDTAGWYARDGSSARRAFLKQPLPLVRITSGYGGRKHPTLGYFKKHEGVDYGAPTGTPVWAVGDGVVTWADWKGANGKLVSIRHSNGYVSHYAHLSKISSELRVGTRVTQKQVIGAVGTTGRSTGPHLHFALSRNGSYVNPLTQQFPSGTPLPEKHRESFAEATSTLGFELDRARAIASSKDGSDSEHAN